MKTILGRERIYNSVFAKMGIENIVRWDILEIKNEQNLIIKFLSTNSKYRQGVRLAIDEGDGYMEINGIRSKEMYLWEDTAPQYIPAKCVSSEGVLSIYNVFDLGEERGGRRSQMDSCGMIVEQKGNIFTYSCNDVGFQSDFDKLIFQIELC